jgi:hypothetical protein
MTFESSIKIFNAAIAKIFKFAIMAFDPADMVFVAAIAKRFDLLIERKFESASRRNSTPVSEEIRPRHPKKFDPGVRRNSTPASEEIRPRHSKKFDPGIRRNSTAASEEIRPRRPKKFDLDIQRNLTSASEEIRPRRLEKFDPVSHELRPLCFMIFDHAGNNKFDHAIIQDIRPSASRSFDPCRAEDFAQHSSTPRSQRFDDFSDR